MKYVVYFSSANGDKDSLIANSKKDLLRELKALSNEGFTVEKKCRIVRGEYISF